MPDGPILIISGTNRPGSHALKIAHLLQAIYQRESAPAEILSLEQLPPEAFMPSVYLSKPPTVVDLQNRVLAASGLHLVTPEYNGSFPGVLKYFIDLLKFPESFENKPVAYIGESAGIWGAIRSVEQLQMIFGYRHAHSFPERVFIPGVQKLWDAAGNMADAAMNERLVHQVKGFIKYAQRVKAGE
jgi:chromate reductase